MALIKAFVNGAVVEIDDASVYPTPTPPPVPQSVTSAQAKVLLYRLGILAQVEAVISTYPADVRLWYEHSGTWLRTNPYVQGLALELGLDDDDLDQMFRDAAKLET